MTMPMPQSIPDSQLNPTAFPAAPAVVSVGVLPVAEAPSRPARVKARRGFAVMDPQRQREIASEGGRAAHERGNAHEFTSEEARQAGRKGGQSISQNREHMAAIGSKGGAKRNARKRQILSATA